MGRDAGPDESTEFRIVQRGSIQFEYPVVFTRGVFAPENDALIGLLAGGAAHPRVERALAVIDAGVDGAWPRLRADVAAYFDLHRHRVELVGEPLVVAGGEEAKNDPGVVSQVLERLFVGGFDRHSYLIAIGGGAVLDAVGYAAGVFHRGMRLIRVPSTVLAQNDAGVGVKNGVNAFGVKNALGTFAPPFAVVNDHALLASLPLRDHLAGIAEAIKVGLIRDRAFFDWLVDHAAALRAREESATLWMIRRCAELHLEHIRLAGDPFEKGSARPLDFGHWAAHKLELLSHHALRHGEAVAIGMALDTRYAALAGILSSDDAGRVQAAIRAIGLPVYHPALDLVDGDGTPLVLRGLEEFREHLGGQLSVTLLRALGEGVEVHQIDHLLMKHAICAAKLG